MTDKILSMIGLAAKAGRLRGGDFAVKDSVRNGKSFLVIIAADASENTKKVLSDKCRSYNVPFLFYGTKEELGLHSGRSLTAGLSVEDRGFAGAIRKLAENGHQ